VLDEPERRNPDYVLTVGAPGRCGLLDHGVMLRTARATIAGNAFDAGVDTMSDKLHVGRSSGYYWVNWSGEPEPALWDGVRWYFIGTADDAPDQPIVLSDVPIVFAPALQGAHGREADRGA